MEQGGEGRQHDDMQRMVMGRRKGGRTGMVVPPQFRNRNMIHLAIPFSHTVKVVITHCVLVSLIFLGNIVR